MVKQALTEKRPWLLASIAAAIAFYVLQDEPIGGLWLILLKGSAVALIAIYALHRDNSADARLLAVVMALSAIGDMLIELSLQQGGAAFFMSHLAAIALYLRNLRHGTPLSQKGAAAAIFVLTPWICWLLSSDLAITFYGFGLGAMAATAWMSRFSRYRVGIGALLFVVSDWLIFADIPRFEGNVFWLDALIWPLYYVGQFLIATGVIQTLRQELPDAE